MQPGQQAQPGGGPQGVPMGPPGQMGLAAQGGGGSGQLGGQGGSGGAIPMGQQGGAQQLGAGLMRMNSQARPIAVGLVGNGLESTVEDMLSHRVNVEHVEGWSGDDTWGTSYDPS
jgi:hypothetical protein